jgi:hypothetical protein
MRRGLEAVDEDPVVDLVVVMHIRRLVANADAALGAELDSAYAARVQAAGVSEPDAAAADLVTDLCDRLSFSFCFEEAGGGTSARSSTPYGLTASQRWLPGRSVFGTSRRR